MASVDDAPDVTRDDVPDDPVAAYLQAHRERLLNRLSEWVRIPSVAGVPERHHHLLRSANWLSGALRDIGFPVTEVWPGDDGEAVYGAWCEAPGAPTVLVYSHHDVRAVKEDNWDQTSPFDPVARDGRLYGRGTSDAKGQVAAHLWGVRSHLATTRRTGPAVNLKLVVEGEEEAGSPGLARLLDEHREKLAADLVVFSDTLLWRTDHPAACTSVRGMLGARLEVYGPYTDIHSGAVSGAAPNPAVELARLIAQLHDDHGRITLPGFYDPVPELPQERRDALARLPFDEEDWLIRSHTRSVGGEEGYTVLERLWERPALEVIAMTAGDPVGVSRASIPSMASADLSIRTVAGQSVHDVADQLRAWVDERVGDRFGHELTVSMPTSQEAYRTPEVPALDALTRAIARGFGVDVGDVGRMGNAGGGPADLLATAVDAPILFFGTGLVEDNWHDSDESVRIDVLLSGAATLAHLWAELGATTPEEAAGRAAEEATRAS
ncbi:M20/M25/M40 family metallo-hydrolase [Puerhibacterium puerhi]|uniref:M20/M25/M40 family metallo-hydrolase n=1 Tax=Puerhibacterium puerhi TaxID=2692623 RepID=UPI001359762E|nr:M20/M25/M40 family metallo-hydrolase [Puerhibacterium puerhi]